MITSTTIGAYPKPPYVPITDWFTADPTDGQPIDYTTAYADELAAAGKDAEALFRRATTEIIGDQVEAGIDVVTDGEVRRENYIHHQCRHFHGFDFDNLGHQRLRGTVDGLLPTIRSEVAFVGSPLAGEFEIAQSLSSAPVKVTVPGPMTIIDTTTNEHYHDQAELGAALAVAINGQILDLVAAGCRHIQVDEPVMARKPDIALDHGIEHLGRCFDHVPTDVVRAVHCCCGYPNRLDQDDYPKADPSAYLRLAPALDAAPLDQVSIEDAHRPNDLAALLPMFAQRTVILGVIAIARSRLEAVDEIAIRLEEAFQYLPEARLVAAPDCGLGFLTREQAQAKLLALTTAVKQINGTNRSP